MQLSAKLKLAFGVITPTFIFFTQEGLSEYIETSSLSRRGIKKYEWEALSPNSDAHCGIKGCSCGKPSPLVWGQSKHKAGFGLANFTILLRDGKPFQVALHNTAGAGYVYEIPAPILKQFAQIRKDWAIKLKKAAKVVASFTGVLVIATGHEDWGYNSHDCFFTVKFAYFDGGKLAELKTIETIETQYNGTAETDRAKNLYECCTRMNGEHESHTYLLEGVQVPSSILEPLVVQTKGVEDFKYLAPLV